MSKVKPKKRLIKVLRLRDIQGGMPGLRPAKARAFIEAAAVCLEDQGHEPGAHLHVSGYTTKKFSLQWEAPDESQRRTYADEPEATEEGATAVAVALVTKLTKYVVVERARKGTGFDYWLGREVGRFDARLEISGIRCGQLPAVKTRTKKKVKQMAPSDDGGLPGYAVIVEFSRPLANMVKK